MSINALDPFAFARQDEADAEVFARLAEHRRCEQSANERDIDDDERARTV